MNAQSVSDTPHVASTRLLRLIGRCRRTQQASTCKALRRRHASRRETTVALPCIAIASPNRAVKLYPQSGSIALLRAYSQLVHQTAFTTLRPSAPNTARLPILHHTSHIAGALLCHPITRLTQYFHDRCPTPVPWPVPRGYFQLQTTAPFCMSLHNEHTQPVRMIVCVRPVYKRYMII